MSSIEWMIVLCDLGFLAYFLAINTSYLGLDLLSGFYTIRRQIQYPMTEQVGNSVDSEPGITLIVPAHNEEDIVIDTVKSLLQMEYRAYEVVIVNDGSTDGTLDKLMETFGLHPFPEVYREQLETLPVREIYHSYRHQQLRVIDKENGGKPDALNAGLNLARYPLVCSIDADSVLNPDSLSQVAEVFVRRPETIGVGGSIRVLNHCEMENGQVQGVNIPWNPWVLLQIVEYLRAFLFGRVGWNLLNGLMIISGAFGVFKKEALMSIGGYKETSGDDMEIVVRLHRHYTERNEPYAIRSIPEPICWTEVPSSFRDLMNQRVSWQMGLTDSLAWNTRLCFHPNGGGAGWIGYPYMAFFECFGALIEVFGYLFMLGGYAMGWIPGSILLLFLWVAVGLGTLHSVVALVLEELFFRQFPGRAHIPILFAFAILENLGYRQLNSVFRVMGLLKWMRNPRWDPGITPQNRPSDRTRIAAGPTQGSDRAGF